MIPAVVGLSGANTFLKDLSTAEVCEGTLPSVFRILVYHPLNGTLVGIGSGFFIRPDGTALTACHVIIPQHKLKVKLDNGKELEAKFLAGHHPTDIGLIKVHTQDLVIPVKVGNSDQLKRGEQVIHIGNTMFSDSNDIDVGYVNKLDDDTPEWLKSQLKGDMAPPESGLSFIKTTGSVRPGFSGGPLVNMKGEVVGLISRVFVQMHQTGPEHEGASIPINFVETIIKQLEERGQVERPYIGCSFMKVEGGLGILKVQPGSPAEASGLKVGDVLLAVNNKKMKHPEDFFKVIGYQKGVEFKLEVLRSQKTINLTISA